VVRPGHLSTCRRKECCPRHRRCECDSTAIHEAAHAIACIHLGVRLLYIDTRKRQSMGSLGSVVHERPRSKFHEAVICLSGPLAQAMYTGRWDGEGASNDLDHFRSLKLGAILSLTTWIRTLHLLIKRWKDIRSLASSLPYVPPFFPGAAVRRTLSRTSKKSS
jgi:hypothetical protein